MSNYYEVLKIDKSANIDEIKKAYRKLALKWHPDKNPTNRDEAEEKFKKIAEAYAVLSDPEKKKKYDTFGTVDDHAGMPSHMYTGNGAKVHVFNGSNMGNAHKIFEEFFSGENMFDSHFSPFHSFSGKKRKQVIENDLPCTLEELYNGCTKKLKVEGKVLTIDIKKGWKEGTKITFDEDFDNIILVFVIKERNHDVFHRTENDLSCELTITCKEAQTGFTKTIKLLDDTTKTIKLKGIESSDYVYTIADAGMPIRKQGNIIGHGKLYVSFIVKFT